LRIFSFFSFLWIINFTFGWVQVVGAEQASMIDLIRQKNGFSAEIPAAVCNRIFPYHKIIDQKLSSNVEVGSFRLFSFTATEFDPTKPSILFIQGGPGGMWGPREALESSKQFPDANIIFFHYRGGGCSDFINKNPDLDKYISSSGTVSDMEAIRIAYGIKIWKSVVGFSYGTDIARRYAHRFPNRIESLVLEGLSSSEQLSSDQVLARILKTVSDRYKVSAELQSVISSEEFKRFVTTLKNYLSQVSPSQNFGLAALWEFYEKALIKSYSANGELVPKYFNRSTFLSVTLLMYSGETDSSDLAILMLLYNFNYGQISAEKAASFAKSLRKLDRYLLPYLYQDYLSILDESGLVSWRVNLTMTENDKSERDDSLCSSVRTIVINGTQDLATPIENVEKFLNNKFCASATNTALLIQGGGHSNMSSMSCLNRYVNHAINNQEADSDLKLCELPVIRRTF
jgi:pimeloyl-ACP methyl ester carboxylesterase